MTLKQCSAGQMVRHISSKRMTITGLISLGEQWIMGIRAKSPEPGEESCIRQMRNYVGQKMLYCNTKCKIKLAVNEKCLHPSCDAFTKTLKVVI